MASGGPLTVGTVADKGGGAQRSFALSEGFTCIDPHIIPSSARGCCFAPLMEAAEIEDERALVDSYGMLGKGIQEAIEIHNSRLGQMRRAVRFIRVMILRFS